MLDINTDEDAGYIELTVDGSIDKAEYEAAVQAIEQAATLAEQRAGFVAEALGAREQMLTTGEGYDAADVHDWLKARVTDRKAARPQAKPWRG